MSKQEKKTDKETEDSNIISGSRFHMILCRNLRELHRRIYSASTYIHTEL